MSEYKLLNKDEFDQVFGEVYKITNIINGMCYVGQTRSHHLNHGKYRPFGSVGRFKAHLSESKCLSKVGCRCLDNAILQYGESAFKYEILTKCKIDELDYYECKYIAELNTMHPNGYNMTDGGRYNGNIIHADIEEFQKPGPNKDYKHSEETKKKIASGIKQSLNTEENRKSLMQRAQTQHSDKKFELLKDVKINMENPESHICIRKDHKNNYEFVVLIFDGKKRISFVGKHEPLDNTITRAKDFIKELITRRHNQIAGTTLEL